MACEAESSPMASRYQARIDLNICPLSVLICPPGVTLANACPFYKNILFVSKNQS